MKVWQVITGKSAIGEDVRILRTDMDEDNYKVSGWVDEDDYTYQTYFRCDESTRDEAFREGIEIIKRCAYNKYPDDKWALVKITMKVVRGKDGECSLNKSKEVIGTYVTKEMAIEAKMHENSKNINDNIFYHVFPIEEE